MKKSEILNAQAAADVLGMHVDTLRRLCREGVGPDYRKGQGSKGRYMFLLHDVLAWHRKQYQSSSPPVAQPEAKVEVETSADESSQTLSVWMLDNAGFAYHIEFEGKWIIDPDEEMRASEPESNLQFCFAAAKTKGGRYALYTWKKDFSYPPTFEHYEEIDEISGDIPRSIIEAIRLRTEENYIVRLDI